MLERRTCQTTKMSANYSGQSRLFHILGLYPKTTKSRHGPHRQLTTTRMWSTDSFLLPCWTAMSITFDKEIIGQRYRLSCDMTARSLNNNAAHKIVNHSQREVSQSTKRTSKNQEFAKLFWLISWTALTSTYPSPETTELSDGPQLQWSMTWWISPSDIVFSLNKRPQSCQATSQND